MMRRRLIWTAALALAVASAVSSAEEAAWQRMLKGDEAKKATELKQQADKFIAEGKFAQAIEPAEEQLRLRQRVQGGKHWETVDARVLRDTLKHIAAQPAVRQRDCVRANEQMAEADRLRQQGRYDQAEPLYRQALSVRREVLGEQHSHTAISLNNFAANLDAQGNYAQAESLYRRVLAINRKVLGEEHPFVALTLNNLATNLHKQGKYAEAEPLLRQTLATLRELLGEQHTVIATTLNNLAYNLNVQGKHAEAEPLNRQALATRRQVLGEQHPALALDLLNLAYNLQQQGRDAEAEPLYRQALTLYRKALPEQPLDIARGLNNLASNLHDQGKYAEAETLIRQALSIHRQVLGEQHSLTATGLNNLAANLDAQRKYGEAEPMYRQSLAIFRKNLGEQHPRIASSLNNLADNLEAQGQYAKAETLYRQALGIRRKLLGEQHVDTAHSFDKLASNLYAQGQHTQAVNNWRLASNAFEVVRWNAASSGFNRAVFASKNDDPNLKAAGCLARLGQFAEAWRYTEAALGRGLLDDLTSQTQVLLSPDEQKTLRIQSARLEQLNRLLLPLLSAEKPTASERNHLEEFVKEREDLQAESARQAAQRSRREVWSLERIQKQIPPDTALVFWIDMKAAHKAADPTGEHWGCAVRRLGEPAWVRLPGSGEKEAWTASDDDLPRRLRDDLTGDHPGWQDHAQQLTRQRLTPLQTHLKARAGLPAVRHLIAVPAGAMAGIPLEVLSNDYTISYAPSGTFFARLQEQHRMLHQPSLLAVGDPNFNLPNDKPQPLPEHGLLLTLVLSSGNASKAGLQSGDVLLSYNGHPLHALADLKPASSGASVPVQVWRDGKTFEARLSPGQLGVSIDRQPAAEAVRRQRDFDALLASRSRDKISSLPASRFEVKALELLFAKATVLLGSDASEQKLDDLASADQLKDYRVLHLATHGEVNLSSALQSSLLLARDRLPDLNEQARKGGKIYDGRLRAATMAAHWRLDADLVTLSACQTALGPSGGGDGLLGFSQVLLRKGARSLLLSLWKVDDTATALLMTRFYENWLGRRKDLQASLSKSESLREAKQWLRNLRRAERDRLASRLVSGELRGTVVAAKPVTKTTKDASETPYAHPRYWAAFILIGDPE